MNLLQLPDFVALGGPESFAVAFWRYMTPRYWYPSPHEVTIKRWIPSEFELKNGIRQGFGTTTNILYGPN